MTNNFQVCLFFFEYSTFGIPQMEPVYYFRKSQSISKERIFRVFLRVNYAEISSSIFHSEKKSYSEISIQNISIF